VWGLGETVHAAFPGTGLSTSAIMVLFIWHQMKESVLNQVLPGIIQLEAQFSFYVANSFATVCLNEYNPEPQT
jgi:hypothetical protein